MFHVKHFFGFIFSFSLAKNLAVAYTIICNLLPATDLTGLRPFKLPHTRGEPLVNPPERLCGAKIPR